MPLYGTSAPVALFPGDIATLFNADTIAAGNSSVAVTLPTAPFGSGAAAVLSFDIAFAASPTDVLTIQAADVDADGNYVNTSSASTNKQTDRIDISINAAFARITTTSFSGGGVCTVKVRRAA